jgi:hypothetical protein
MAGRKRESEIFVAKTSFACEVDGERLFINQGERVRSGHPLLKNQGAYFEPADTTVHFDMPDVEQATAAPGEKRGA